MVVIQAACMHGRYTGCMHACMVVIQAACMVVIQAACMPCLVESSLVPWPRRLYQQRAYLSSSRNIGVTDLKQILEQQNDIAKIEFSTLSVECVLYEGRQSNGRGKLSIWMSAGIIRHQ